MGLLEKIFGIYTPEIPQPPVMTSVLPVAATAEIQTGKLPTLNVGTISLKPGEVCHYVDESCMLTQKIEKHYQRRNNGMSFKVTKGMYYHIGDSNSHPIEYEIPVYTKGYLYITNRRILFVSKEKGFDKGLEKVSAITPYTDAVGFQFGEKIYNILTPSSQYAAIVLKLLGK